LAEFYPNWPNFTQIGEEKQAMGLISAKLDEIQLNPVAENFRISFIKSGWFVLLLII
jgi:hypothetical protein